MKKNYHELIEILNNFHTVVLLDSYKTPNSKWLVTMNRICQMLYKIDYKEFLRVFPVDKNIIMPGTLEAHYNLINAIVDYNQNLVSIKVHQEMYECAMEVKYIFEDFLYINKYKIHRSAGPNTQFQWYNIVPII